ncbi:MAG: response regulator [Leptolyngbyaceae cyanobacterium MO_188.B28]|nr:response regulator [Leptolyngbyaceae cyanobacterium MO_188.B28]
MKILVVEDDSSVAQTLQNLLTSYHYAVDIAVDGEVVLQIADTFDYDLVILDILLPGLNGVRVCQQLRAKGLKMPILLLTAQDDAAQKANALNAGADDYVVKPFDSEELMARVHALLRRGETQPQPILTWGDLSIDPRSRYVIYGTHLLSLTPKEYGILELLLRNNQQVFSARAILDQVWRSTESPGEEVVRVHIKEVRKKLKAAGAPGDLIKTVHRVGYRLNSAYSGVARSPTDEPPAAAQMAGLEPVDAGGDRMAVSQSAPAEPGQKGQASAFTQPLSEAEKQQLQARNGELERRVAELAAALLEAHRQLQQRDQAQRQEALGRLDRGIVHELNNVFTPILATAQLLRLTQKGLDAAAQKQLKLIEETAKRGARLVKQILNLRTEGQEE